MDLSIRWLKDYAVSYTHLDVYKRQAQIQMVHCGSFPFMQLGKTTKR